MDRPLVINSLLCFIHNFRDSPRLRHLVEEYFPHAAILEAQTILEGKMQHTCNGDVFALYEQLANNNCLPVFAATDLAVMPISLVKESDEKSELLREMRGLKRYIRDALNGRVDDSPVVSARIFEPENMMNGVKQNTSASSPELPLANNYSHPTIITDSSKNSNSEVSPVESLSPPKCNTPSKRKSNGTKSLDEAVRKLNDLNRNKSESCGGSPNPPLLAPWAPVHVDPQSYLTMIRNIIHANGAVHTVPSNAYAINVEPKSEKLDDDKLIMDGLDEDNNYEDSSPSPSEEIRDDYDAGNDADKPFTCEHVNCHKRFANKFLLKKHQFIHTGLRPHTCPYCNKRFNRKDNLLRHKKTHIQGGVEELNRRQALNLLIAGHEVPGLAMGIGMEQDDDEM